MLRGAPDGGTALRLETDGNAAGVHNVIADRIYAQHGSRIASLTPHCQVNDHIRLSHLRGVSVYYGVTLGATPEGSQDRLRAVRSWLERNNSLMMAAVLLVIGVMLVGSGLEAL